ncbi:ras guanine nucleotide exchange factor domain-containing protein [Umbelopsis sp. AD052]|nr:ras guanine nucleotide exchange factor domain-containing protein [Umbelopsis sp. AD052]
MKVVVLSTCSPSSQCFALARQCLQSAESIKNTLCDTNIQNTSSIPLSPTPKSPPPVPPKPKTLKRKPVDTSLINVPVQPQNIFMQRSLSTGRGYLGTPKLNIPQFQVTIPESSLDPSTPFQDSPESIVFDKSDNYTKPEPPRHQTAMVSPQGSVATLRRKLDTVIYRRASSPNLGRPSVPPSALNGRRASTIKGMLSIPHLSRGENRAIDKSAQNSNLIWFSLDSLANSSFHFDNSVDVSQIAPAQMLQEDNLIVPGTQRSNDNIPKIPVPPLQVVYKHFQDQGAASTDRPESDSSENTTTASYIPDHRLHPLVERSDPGDGDPSQRKAYIPDHKAVINQLDTLYVSAAMVQSILHFRPNMVAYQLTLIDSSIFRAIRTDALIEHSAKTPHPNIVASTDFFNYLTRFIEHCILLPQEASVRAQHVNHWIKIASKCLELRNYQTLKAIVSSLGTPPIQRLKRTWSFIPKKSLARLDMLNSVMSESCNYRRYRDRLRNMLETEQKSADVPRVTKPIVPFLGTFIHDVTYIIAFIKSYRGPAPVTSVSTPTTRSKAAVAHKMDSMVAPSDISAAEKLMLKQDQRFVELARNFEYYQKCPDYLPSIPSQFVKSMYKSRRTRLSDALKSASNNKLGLPTSEDDKEDMSVPMQQVVITQYLLTRSWVAEKVIDELSMTREPSQKPRSNSESSTQLTSSLNSNTTTISASSTSSIITFKTNSLGGFRSSSGSYDSDNPCTSGDDPMPAPDKVKGDGSPKSPGVVTEASASSERKENKNLWSFTWKRGSVDDPQHGEQLTTSSQSELEVKGRSMIWSDEFWEGRTMEEPESNVQRGDSKDENKPPGINLLRTNYTLSLPKPQYPRSHLDIVSAGPAPPWSFNRNTGDIKSRDPLLDTVAPWQPVDEPEPI